MYRVWKYYTAWRHQVRYTTMGRATTKLDDDLFTLHPVLSDALLRVKWILHDMEEELELIQVPESGKVMTVNEFVQLQDEFVDQRREYVLSYSSNIRQVIIYSLHILLVFDTYYRNK